MSSLKVKDKPFVGEALVAEAYVAANTCVSVFVKFVSFYPAFMLPEGCSAPPTFYGFLYIKVHNIFGNENRHAIWSKKNILIVF
jgi:hypothetical protein